MSEGAWFKWLLVAIYLLGAFSLPCLPCSEAATQAQYRGPEAKEGNAAAQSDPERRPIPTREAGDKDNAGANKGKECSGGLVCSVVWPRVIHLADVSTYDPVAFFTLVLAVSTIGLWWVTRQTLSHAQEDSDRQAKNSVDARRAWLEIKDVRRIGAAKFDGPFVFFDLHISVGNVGASPALKVWVDAEMFYPGQGGKMSANWDEFLSKSRAHAGNIGNMVIFPRSEDATQPVPLGVPTSFSDAAGGIPFVLVGVFYKYSGDDAIHESTGSFYLTNIPKDKASDNADCFRLTPSLVPFTAT